ncbi:retrotransposable element [Paramuricea clavata]|uniref:Retrotransposable element n=1 Tax=Paramuricea clavata TaxID=317549 RepID=A0A7D9EFA2_PARCT|nr:retrotransposable element [Paramuricea clavata]
MPQYDFVADFIYWTMTRNGCAEIQISDQGREFVNQVSEELHQRTGTEHRITSAYHPQSNGLDERFNQTIQRALRKAVNEKQDNWDEAIDDILFAYRTSVQATTKHTPFYLMFGREARLPIQMEIVPEGKERTLEERLEELADLRKSYGKVADNIKESQDKQKKLYDAKHGASKQEFKQGSLVLLRNSRNDSRKGGKLDAKWLGPYEVVDCLGKNVFKIKNCSTGIENKKKVNAAVLKPYVPSTQQIQPQKDFARPEFKAGEVQTKQTQPQKVPCRQPFEGGYVKVCDSLYDDLAGSTKVQLAQCYQTLIDEFGRLEVDIPPVQTQTGSVDCGLFAIAFAYELAVGNFPVHEVRFDQKKMRSHLLACFEKRELTHFPQVRRQPATQPRQHNSVTIATLCECKLPEEYDNMISCDLCGKWFHFGCVEYDISISTSNEWLCRLCTPPAAKKPKLCM